MNAYLKKMGIVLSNASSSGGNAASSGGGGGAGTATTVELPGNIMMDLGHDELRLVTESGPGPESGPATESGSGKATEQVLGPGPGPTIVTPLTDEEFLMVKKQLLISMIFIIWHLLKVKTVILTLSLPLLQTELFPPLTLSTPFLLRF